MRKYSLDFLRGCAAFSVAIPHFIIARGASSGIPDAVAILAVEVFFILSGFVLAPQLLYCFEKFERIKIFLVRRWMRTLPPFVLALVMVSILAGEFSTKEFYGYLFFLNNFFGLIGNDYFQVAWSLSIEEWFYIFFPAFLFLCKLWRLSPWKIACLFIALSFAGRALLAFESADAIFEMRRLVLFRLDSICFGFALYLVLQKASIESLKAKIALLLAVVASSAIAVTVVLAALDGSHLAAWAYYIVAPTFAALMLSLFYGFDKALFSANVARAVSKYLGDISYGVYLFHIPIIMLMQGILKIEGVGFLAFILAVFLLPTLVRIHFENPILAARPDYRDDFIDCVTPPPGSRRRRQPAAGQRVRPRQGLSDSRIQQLCPIRPPAVASDGHGSRHSHGRRSHCALCRRTCRGTTQGGDASWHDNEQGRKGSSRRELWCWA